jgi:hypothetical protein
MVRESYISMEHWRNDADKRNGITQKNVCANANLSTTNLTPVFKEADCEDLGTWSLSQQL